MPLFMSDAELKAASGDIATVVERADSHIHGLLEQVEAHKARADAAAITSEQRCSVVEQKFLSMSSQFKQLEQGKAQSETALDRLSGELAKAQSQVHKLELEGMKKDSEREQLSFELIEVRKARRDLLDVVDQKNAELTEKNACIKAYLDKIVYLTDDRSTLEGRMRESEAEIARSQALQARLSQEKELLEQHNSWLNNELSDKVSTLLKERQFFVDTEMELRCKLSRAEQSSKEMAESFQSSKEQVKQLDLKLLLLREELKSVKDDAANKVDHLTVEVETATKLAELYKQSSEEWSKKSIGLEGVIKALEVHLSQAEKESQGLLEKEREAQKVLEKVVVELKDKLEKSEHELELYKKDKQQDPFFLMDALPGVIRKELTPSDEQLSVELHTEGSTLPIVPYGVSGTAIAAMLIRDGWSLTKIYIKYQEAIDAWRHERQERKQSQDLLQRVLHEIEQKADMILDERAEHVRMMEAYSVMEEKLHYCIEEQTSFENTIRELKAELRKRERELCSSKKEEEDLQAQVSVLMKELEDVKGYGAEGNSRHMGMFKSDGLPLEVVATDGTFSEALRTFKDIQGMVQQNSQLRALVRSLSHQIEEREEELKIAFNIELKKRTDEAAQKVSTVLVKSEEQTELISSLQGTVGMYKRLYDEQLKTGSLIQKNSRPLAVSSEGTINDLRGLAAKSQEEVEKVRKEAAERISLLENELTKAKQDANAVRMEREHLIVEAAYAREQLQMTLEDSGRQRKEMDSVLARNVEFSQMITDYQQRLRKNAEHVQTVEEKSIQLSVQVSVLEKEKDLISNAEKRASQEVSSLSDRVHRLQATLDNIHIIEEANESMRSTEKKSLQEKLNVMQKEWVEMKQELDAERAHIRKLNSDREEAVKRAMNRVESIGKEHADALRQVSVLEARACVAEARCMELESSLNKAEEKLLLILSAKVPGQNVKEVALEPHIEALSLLGHARDEIEQLKEELSAQKGHTEQYKRLAQFNEEALRRIEDAHNHYKQEAEKTKKALEDEITGVVQKAGDLEKLLSEKDGALAAVEAQRQADLSTGKEEMSVLLEEVSAKRVALKQAEEHINMLKAELEKEHQQRLVAQSNYERQVMLQADTIRELSATSEEKTALLREAAELREKAETSSVELSALRSVWEMEKESLLSQKGDLVNELKELDEQNKLLLDRMETMHALVPEVSGDPSRKPESDLQDVIRFLRRSKEASDLEISLLKQERLRLQKQLESALRAAEDAQSNLRREHENARSALLSDVEFKSLQAQVREMNILRESNAQLRMENKRNFEECQSLRNHAQKEQIEIESLRKLLREREVEIEAAAKDADMQKAELARWQNRVSELLGKYKSLDLEDFQRTQSELASTQEMLKSGQSELESSRIEAQRFLEIISRMEQDISCKDEKIAELERRSQESQLAEGPLKTEVEKMRKQGHFMKRKLENLTKEREDLSREKEGLLKQLEESKTNAGKRGSVETRSEAQIRLELVTQHEQAQKENENLIKEKDSRIQTLERTLEREREDLRKERDELKREKQRRTKDQKLYIDLAQKEKLEMQRLVEELNTLKREKEVNVENMQVRKVGRKIIRPKLESLAIQPSEVGENATETTAEIPEADPDTQDDAKLLLTESLAPAQVSTAIIVPPILNAASSEDIMSSIRKRSLVQAQESAEEPSRQSNKIDTLQPFKRPKSLDPKHSIAELSSAAFTVESLATLDAVEMDIENVQESEVQVIEGYDAGMSGTVETQHAVVVSQRSQEVVEVLQSEMGAVRRPSRIARLDGVKREEILPDSSNEKSHAEPLSGNASLLEEEVQLVTGVDEIVHHDLLGPESNERIDRSAGSVLDTSQLTQILPAEVDTQASYEDLPTSEKEESENLCVDGADAVAPSDDAPGTLHPEVGIQASSLPQVDSTVDEREPGNEGLLSESVLDVEDGEIEPDDQVESNIENISEQEVLEEAGRSENVSNLFIEIDTQAPEDIRGVPSIDLSGEEVKETAGSQVSTLADMPKGGAAVQAEGQQRPLLGARQALRNTTITLTERARERSLIRRSGMPPPSPGRRGIRNVKKASVVQRTRTVPPDGEAQGTEDEDANALGSRPQSTLGTKKFDSSRDEK